MNNNLNNSLPELMRRATENLEPESTDLVERGMRRGATLRRRRTALISFSGATAVLATASIIVGSNHYLGQETQPPAAGPTTTQPTTNAKGIAAKPVSQKETLETLIKLLPAHLKVVKPEWWGGAWGNGAAVVVNDGKGLARISAAVYAPGMEQRCKMSQPGTCLARPDGSFITTAKEEPAYEPRNNPGGVLLNRVTVNRRGTESISLLSTNASAEKGVDKTRAKPILSVAELTKIADSPLWRFPPKRPIETGPAKPEPNDAGVGKPAVPLQQTLQTLKKVLPAELTFTRPETWGGNGGNGASYVINDGKGLSRVDVYLGYEQPVTKCDPEGTPNCQVKSDGSVVGWTKDSPEYSDARQKLEGVLSTRVEIYYPDGRAISMTSYNGPQQKGAKHTRVKPAFSPQQLLAMAGNKAWKFPGTGTK